MTKTPESNPQPTSTAPQTIYMWPRSADPRRAVVYEWLHDNGWRYCNNRGEWWTPENETHQARARLNWTLDHDNDDAISSARLVGPSTKAEAVPDWAWATAAQRNAMQVHLDASGFVPLVGQTLLILRPVPFSDGTWCVDDARPEKDEHS